MGIDELEQRLSHLTTLLQESQAKINQAMADANAIIGAIQEVNYWIAQIEKKQ